MKSIVYRLLVVLCSVSMMYGMESLVEDIFSQEKKDELHSSSQQVPVQQTPIVNIQPSQASQVPRLNLGAAALAKYKSTKTIPKTPIKSHTELTQHILSAKKTHRQMLSESTGMLFGDQQGQDIVIEMNNLQSTQNITKKKSMLPRGLADNNVITNLAQGKFYSPEEVWNFLNVTNPTLYRFSQDRNLSLDDVLMYANLLSELNIHPEALVEYIKSNISLESKKLYGWQKKAAADKQIQKYQKIQNKDPEGYQAIILDVVQSIVNSDDGQNVVSPLNNTHIQMLEKQVATNEGTIRYQYVALIISFIMWLGGFAWGIYGQVTGGPTSAPTRMPTMPPTGMPTFMPTGTPT